MSVSSGGVQQFGPGLAGHKCFSDDFIGDACVVGIKLLLNYFTPQAPGNQNRET